VESLEPAPVRVKGATLVFTKADGRVTEATTDQKGEYSLLIDPESRYTVTVKVRHNCWVHRPSFKLTAGARLNLDFTVVFCPYADGEPPPGTVLQHCPPTGMSYREDRVPLGGDASDYLIVAFGNCHVENGTVIYKPLAIATYPDAVLPVTISFDAYTIKADFVELKKAERVLKVTGRVTITDGRNAPSRTASCVSLKLIGPHPRIVQCE